MPPSGGLSANELLLLKGYLQRTSLEHYATGLSDLALVVGDSILLSPAWRSLEAPSTYILGVLDSSIGRIQKNYLFAKKEGQTSYFLRSSGGEISALFSLRVLVPAPKIALQDAFASSLQLKIGSLRQAKLQFTPSDANDTVYTLQSADSSIAKIVGKSIQGIKNGEVLITVNFITSKISKTFTAQVYSTEIKLDSITVQDTVIAAGDTIRPAIRYYPSNSTQKSYSLSTSSSLVKILGKELIYGLDSGMASISITAFEKSAKTFKVNVKSSTIALQGITAVDVNASVGDTVTPNITFKPSNASDQTYKLITGDSLTASLVGSPMRTFCRKTGSVHVQVISGAFASSYTLTCEEQKIPVTAVSIATLSIELGETKVPTITWTPANASNKNYTLIPKTEGYLQVLGLSLKGAGIGTVPVTLKTSDGGIQAVFNVTITPILVKTISASVSIFYIGQSIAPSVSITPSNATNKNYTFSTANAAVASISGTNLVGQNYGSTTITVKSADGAAQNSFTATVKVPWSSVSTIVANKCNNCHGANYFTEATLKTKATTAHGYVNSGYMPKAPSPALPDNEKTILLRWLLENQ